MFRNGLNINFLNGISVKNWRLPLNVLIAQNGKIGYIDDVTSVYRRHPAGVYSGGDIVFRWKNL